MKQRLGALLRAPVDIAALAAFRIAFGTLLCVAALRFFAHRWIHEYYEVPKHFFHYYGFSWVHPWPGYGMYVHYAAMVVCAACVALGLFYRPAIALFCALFTYAHFVDKTNYLNHYYLVTCLSLVMTVLPLDRAASVRVWRRPDEAWSSAPAWCLWILRFQVACVYFFGGVAKLKADWLVHAQPLTIWLGANTEFPGLGRFFHEKAFAYAFSWCGAVFDLTIVGFLLWRRTRPFAYLVVVFFHVVTARLFQLGMFPWIMTAMALVFFDPSWPRAVFERIGLLSRERREHALPSFPRWGVPIVVFYAAFELLVPFRHVLYSGNVLWTEEGFRFGWNVMLMEKNGAVDMTVIDPATHRRWVVDPYDYLTRYQIKMMSTQPDMILEFAHIVADDYAKRGIPGVEVHVDAQVALNGRRPHALIDPRVDLAKVSEGFGPKPWILPGPTEAPEF